MRDASRHHVNYDRISHTARKESAFIRNSIVPHMWNEPHRNLHDNCPIVPVVGYYTLRRVLQTFEPYGTTMQRIESLQNAIEEAIQHPRTNAVEKGLGDLAIWSLELQKPFILDGEVERA